MLKYPCAEKFKSIQGEGLYTGTAMAFIRLVGCSIGKSICTSCDTNFDAMYPEKGGGLFTLEELQTWVHPYEHICLTGGEPLDRNLLELITWMAERVNRTVHIETSGTVMPPWLDKLIEEGRKGYVWFTVSPKPGYLKDMITVWADEIKVIVDGLGSGPGWPTIADAVKWADSGKLVYLQPRNFEHTICSTELRNALALVDKHPTLRLSTQMHKFLEVR